VFNWKKLKGNKKSPLPIHRSPPRRQGRQENKPRKIQGIEIFLSFCNYLAPFLTTNEHEHTPTIAL
jgi:hypothetical protein